MAKKWLEEYDQKLQESKLAVYADRALKLKPCSLRRPVLMEDLSSRNHPVEAAQKTTRREFWHLAKAEEIVQNQKKLGGCPIIGICCDIWCSFPDVLVRQRSTSITNAVVIWGSVISDWKFDIFLTTSECYSLRRVLCSRFNFTGVCYFSANQSLF